MSIISEIQRIKTNITNIYNALESQGVVLPTVKNTSNLILTVNSTIPRIPINCAGLCFWLDGDCNTRNGIDRNKKYFENLVWNKPLNTEDMGTYELIENSGTNNIWRNNLLKINDRAVYPQILTGATDYTVEVVFTKLQSQSDCIFLAPGGVSHLLEGGNIKYYTTAKSSFVRNITISNSPHYTAFRYIKNTTTTKISYPETNSTVSDTFTVPIQTNMLNSCLGCNPSRTSNFADHRHTDVEVGMVRYWCRYLSDSEIQANYKDAKKRFGCL